MAKIPYGWLECNGQAVLRSTYSELFTKFSTQLYDQTHTLLSRYGEGNGLTTFNLPDYRECALIGVGTNGTNTIVAHDVYTVGQFKDDQLQGHKHNDSGHNHTFNCGNWENESSQPRGSQAANWFTYRTELGYANLGLPTKYDDNYGNPRTGTTTHGKQIGITYIIKAL